MAPHSPALLRLSAAVFAALLGLQAAWIVAAELSRPSLPFFPVNKADAEEATARHSAAAAAAHIGWPRGDLWVEDALTAAATVLSNVANGVTEKITRNQSYGIAQTAAALAPSDARIWLVLATLNRETSSNDSAALAQVKMSYYTSPYDEDLFPLRIQIIARSAAINDDELRGFVEYEVGMVIRERPDLKQAVVSAYRNGSPAGRRILEAAVGNKDPQLLAELRAIGP